MELKSINESSKNRSRNLKRSWSTAAQDLPGFTENKSPGTRSFRLRPLTRRIFPKPRGGPVAPGPGPAPAALLPAIDEEEEAELVCRPRKVGGG